MTKPKFTDKQTHDVHKLVYLANEYPDKTIRELGELFAMTMIEVNSAIWRAQDLGLLFVDKQTGYFKVEMVPEKWELGPEVEDLRVNILYVLGKLAEDEQDMEEHAFGVWTAGHGSHNVLTAMKSLLNENKVASYDLDDEQEVPVSKKAKGRGKQPEIVKNTYTFYSLWDNAEQQWGRKQFKDDSKVK